jgi:hypothetical protein
VKTHSLASAIRLPKSRPQKTEPDVIGVDVVNVKGGAAAVVSASGQPNNYVSACGCGGAEGPMLGQRGLRGAPGSLFECGGGRCSLTEIHAGSSIEAHERYAVPPRRPTVNGGLAGVFDTMCLPSL